jgi:hypothetical protein
MAFARRRARKAGPFFSLLKPPGPASGNTCCPKFPKKSMNSIVYIIGAIVIVVVILKLLGLF